MGESQLIDAEELASMLDAAELRIVDCRFSLLAPEQGLSDYGAGHIPGAVYAHLDNDLAAPVSARSGRHPLPDADRFVRCLREWGISNDSRVVVYDDASGGLAARLWWLLRWVGHTRVVLLDGGFVAWSDAGLPISTEVPEPEEGSFVGRAKPDMVIDVHELCERLAADTPFRLVDARDAARFRGEVEPIDSVAGHVPGAKNLPFTDSLDTQGRWLSEGELSARWGRLGVQEREWAVMCGSGVTACHLALSAVQAGLPEPRLYVGSWSEWIRDEGRPVATGS